MLLNIYINIFGINSFKYFFSEPKDIYADIEKHLSNVVVTTKAEVVKPKTRTKEELAIKAALLAQYQNVVDAQYSFELCTNTTYSRI